jgi:hypothetical protein
MPLLSNSLKKINLDPRDRRTIKNFFSIKWISSLTNLALRKIWNSLQELHAKNWKENQTYHGSL